MPETLKIYVQGFFLFPVSRNDGRCAAFAAPKVKRNPHTCYLRGFEHVPPAVPSMLPVDLARCCVYIGKQADATTEGFGIVPHFESLRCGAQVKSSWATKEDDINVLVRLGGGRLVAEPDSYTNKYCWSWDDCAGKPLKRRVTSLVRYELEFNDPLSVQIRPTSDGGTQADLTFDSSSCLHLVHGPVDENADAKDIDDAHIDATKRLCDPDGSGPRKYGTRVDDSRRLVTVPERPPEVDKALEDRSILFKGRPNCGARQMGLY